ncbi:FAD-dependent monooxygenase [Tenggerimyces flavus]|uniref:FAD-dependent monooxygenase n=1 Tax=Tenggerimyces flavus TaxID=1708749 RepID=A0ABV7YKN9_9ACTN|nr:FAD-dependent monooxygenase [Tenggerimyces flavus]MBM7784742.1 2-polyprenyl-6-methoxyphenol hydroxylase-like FAD-dependent oxidoreductase [Tenggerimyces flavus]
MRGSEFDSSEGESRCTVAVVGGGPAGVMLSYLLARAGVAVTLLESHNDFDRRFRGDSIAPSILDYLDLLGLSDPLLAAIPHTRADAFVWSTADRSYRIADYRGTSRKYPFYALVPQGRFLPFIVDQAHRYSGFRLELGARASSLIREPDVADGRVVGVGYAKQGRRHRLRADLVVGADGRNSKIRQLSSITATELGAELDICWYAVPRRVGDPDSSGLGLIAEPGTILAVLGQADSWQVGYTLPAGTFPSLRARGIEPVVSALRRRLPWLDDRLDELVEVGQLSLLPVRITKVDRWSEPGLLLIGDAAHVISPVGGNGINYAILDAAEAGNHLVSPLLAAQGAEQVDPSHLDAATAAVENARRPAVDREQDLQRRIERAAARRLRRGQAAPALALRLATLVPGLARALARRSARALAVPAPSPTILAGRGERSD